VARTATVWAPVRLKELSGRTGFVQCDRELAAALLAADEVQNPRIGGNLLRRRQAGEPRAARLKSAAAPPPAPPPDADVEADLAARSARAGKPKGKVTK
jgi:hypothetical protein